MAPHLTCDDRAVSAWSELWASHDLVRNLTLREIRATYKRTALGHGWALVNPLAYLLIFTLLFSVLLRAAAPEGHPSGVNTFALWLGAALLPWTFFSRALTQGTQALVMNAGLIKKVYFPREALVASTVLSALLTLVIELAVLAGAMVIFGGNPLPWLPLTLAAAVLLGVFSFGLALMLSVANAYFRDTAQIATLLLQFWFYLTPVLYPATLVDEAVARRGGISLLGHELPVSTLYRTNPMAQFVELFRALLYDNRWGSLQAWIACVTAAIISLVLGAAVFRRFAGRLAEEL
jgi:ABC-2 type transport system permease protein